MKKYLALFMLMAATTSLTAQNESLDWDFFHPIKKEWMHLGQKGSVQEALISLGELPDPFYGLNESKFGWIENHDWEFKAILTVKKEELKKDYVMLDFPSIDTYGKIYVNDSLVGKTTNAFIPHRFNVKKYLKAGVNEIHVIITPPVQYHGERWKTEKYHLPAPNDVHDTAIAPYTRKPQYQFGWDWSLRMNTMGFNKPAQVVGYNEFRITNYSVQTLSIENDQAQLKLTAYVEGDSIDFINWKSELFGEEKVPVVNGIATRTVALSQPKLWWPRGYGEAHLYNDKYEFYSTDKKRVRTIDLKFGVKTSELVNEPDEWGTSYYFKINGVRVFAKGANYIPQDIFPSKITPESIQKYVHDMAISNFNMVRVWGGGYYQDEAFYNACDAEGIMVWQDLMFACAMYRGDDEFIADVREELEYQIPRISRHASIVQFNGNNEVEVAWGNWGFQIKYGLYGKSAQEIEAAYDRLFKGLAPEVIAATTTLPYIHTSPLSNWGKAEFYNHGSQHYWGVWHGKDPMEDFGKKIGRFNAEYGFQSFPEYSTLLTFSKKEDWDISSDVMKQHQKSYVGNDMIMKHAKRLYGEPADFEQFVYYSQLTQAMAVSMAIGGHRIDAPRCGGTLVWQLNDCWPVSSWSSIDYYGNWKALQYKMREDYEDLAVLAKYNDLKDIEYFIVNDIPGPKRVFVAAIVKDLKGKVISDQGFSYEFEGPGKFKIDVDLEKGLCAEHKNKVIEFTWTINGIDTYRRSYDIIQKEYHKTKESDVELELTDINLKDKTALLIIKNDHYVRDLWIASYKFGVRFSENFKSYLPGEQGIRITFEEEPKLEDFKMMWN